MQMVIFFFLISVYSHFYHCLSSLGLKAPHSFVIGVATEAAGWSIRPEVAKWIGRWESNLYRSYNCLLLILEGLDWKEVEVVSVQSCLRYL